MDLTYTCTDCGGKHEMLEPCDKEILKKIREKREMIFFLNTKSPKKHYHRVQGLESEIKELKQQLENRRENG